MKWGCPSTRPEVPRNVSSKLGSTASLSRRSPDDGRVDLVINIPREYDEQGRPDGYQIRRRAVDAGIPLITDLKLAGAVVEALRSKRPHELGIVAWGDYMERRVVPLS